MLAKMMTTETRPQQVGLVVEMRFEIIGNGERVGFVRVLAQRFGDQQPVDRIPHETAGQKPDGRKPFLVGEADRAQHRPGAFGTGGGGNRRDPGFERTVGEKKIRGRAGDPGGDDADSQHQQHIENEDRRNGSSEFGHGGLKRFRKCAV